MLPLTFGRRVIADGTGVTLGIRLGEEYGKNGRGIDNHFGKPFSSPYRSKPT